MATVIPHVVNWSVTPVNGNEDYFTKMNVWLSESTSVISSLNGSIDAINQAIDISILQNGAIDDNNIAINRTFSNLYIQENYYDKDEVDSKININGFTDKPTPIDTDNFAIQETGGLLKKLSFANLKSTLLSYFDTFYSRTTNVFGIGQSIVDVTNLRTKGTNHTNDTNKTIFVMIKAAQNGDTTATLYINGVLIMSSGVGTDAVWFPVPSGQTYQYNDILGGTNAYKWIEYR